MKCIDKQLLLRRVHALLWALVLVLFTVLGSVNDIACAASDTPYRTETFYDPISIPSQTVRNTPVYDSDLTTRILINNKKVKLPPDTSVTVTEEKIYNGKKWFRFDFLRGETLYTGYAKNRCIVLKNSTPSDAKIINITTPRAIRAHAEVKGALRVNGKKVTVTGGDIVSFVAETAVGTAKWYEISLTFGGQTVNGFIKPKYVQLTKTKRIEKVYAMTSEEFELSMDAQDIPEMYKPYLRTLHEQFPFWEFRAYKTGLDWQTAL